VSATLVEEEGQGPSMVGMEIDSHGSAGEQKMSMTGNPQQPSRVEVDHQTNGIDNERTKYDGLGSQPMVGYALQYKVKIEYIVGHPESGGQEGELEVGPSIVPTKRKGKQPIP
jgi:hypothetical protein